jgi:anti-sigma factor RsiW
MMECTEIRGRLSLYLDNELQDDERFAIDQHLLACESCAATFHEEESFLNVVRQSGPLHVASPELRSKVAQIVSTKEQSTSQQSRRWIPLAIAAAVLIAVLPLIVWNVLQRNQSPVPQTSSFALMAADTHLRRTRGQLPLEIESATPQQISAWFANKVNFSVKLPNYQESSGQEKLYTLEGARLVGFKDDYAAYVAYEMKARPISLVITSDSVAQPAGGEEMMARGLKFHYNAIQGLKVITWSDRGLTYALVSDLEERGQQSCIVCHQGTKDQDLIAPLSR